MHDRPASGFRSLIVIAILAAVAMWAPVRASAAADLTAVIRDVAPRMVKIYGAGGFRGLEAYQSGFLVSGEGHVVTVWSYVLNTDFITVVLADGRKFDAELLNLDPRLELAVLKIDAAGLPHFNLVEAVSADAGTQVLAFSNLYGIATGNEPASVQHGVVSIRSGLHARRGVFETPYDGPAYILDAITNNPGAAGGALTDRQGNLLGMLGKELRNSLNNAWLNYAVPVEEMEPSIQGILSGEFVRPDAEATAIKPENALSLELLGLVMVPDVLERTPPYVDVVRPGSPAAEAGLKPDDLVMFVNDRLVQSCKSLASELSYIDRIDAVKVTVNRGQELVDVLLRAPGEEPSPAAR